MVKNMDTIALKEKLGANLSGLDREAQFATVLYFSYKTIQANTRMSVRRLKALLCVEYLIKEDLIEGAISALVSRSMFNCVKRWRDPERPVNDMSISVTEPPPSEFEEWMARTEAKYPELRMFVPPLFHHKD